MGALSAAVLSGIVWMAMAGAPRHYLLVNGAALLLAFGVSRLKIGFTAAASLVFAAILVALLWLPLSIGPDVDGVRRWLSMGPVTLHVGMLLLPMLVAMLPSLKQAWGTAIVMAAALAIALQPDRAAALALVTAMIAIAVSHRTRIHAAWAMIALAAFVTTLLTPDTLQPVRFVETVLQDAAFNQPILAVIMALSLINLLSVCIADSDTDALIASVFGGFTAASLLGPYPTPIIGYGAAAIVGYGLAITAQKHGTSPS